MNIQCPLVTCTNAERVGDIAKVDGAALVKAFFFGGIKSNFALHATSPP